MGEHELQNTCLISQQLLSNAHVYLYVTFK